MTTSPAVALRVLVVRGMVSGRDDMTTSLAVALEQRPPYWVSLIFFAPYQARPVSGRA
ncbi:MAG: hypothetical protein ACJ788_21565 [Ktedonobacteraceae bacterium]